jgi:hypothetical protein
MSDDLDNLNHPPPEGAGTDETPALPEPGTAELALVRALRDLVPAPPAINRDRLMYAAGASSRLNSTRLWQFAAGLLAAMGFAAGMYFKPPVIIVREVSIGPTSSPSLPLVQQDAEPKIVPQPETVVPSISQPEPTPEPAVNVHVRSVKDPYYWLQIREDVLSVGLSALPDSGPKSSPPRNVGIDQPGTLQRGTYGEK